MPPLQSCQPRPSAVRAPAPVTRNDISTHAESRLCALDQDTAALIVAFTQKREGPMELLELDSPSYGVSTPGIYIIDDDGERVCAGPFDSKSRPLPGLTPVSKTSSNTGGCKTPECLTGSPRRSSVTDQTSWNPNDPVRSRSQCVHLPPRDGLAEAGGESQGRHRAGSARAGWLRATYYRQVG